MKIAISDTSFHNKIISRYRKGKRAVLMFPSMFFLRSARNYLSKIIDMHVRLNLQIHHKYMGLSSVFLQKFHDMKLIFSSLKTEKQILREVSYRSKDTFALSKIYTRISGFYEINKILTNGSKIIFETPIFRIENYNLNKSVLFHKENEVYRTKIFYPLIILPYKQTSGYPITNTITYSQTLDDQALNYSGATNNSIILQKATNGQTVNNIILSRTPNRRILNCQTIINTFFHSEGRTINYPHMADSRYLTHTKHLNYQNSNYLQIVNNIILSRTPSRRILNCQTIINTFFHSERRTINYPHMADSRYLTHTKHLNYQNSNYLQKVNYIFSNPGIIHDVNNLNYLKIENAKTQVSRNNFSMRLIEQHYNTIFKVLTNFWKGKMETNQHFVKLYNITSRRSERIKDIPAEMAVPDRGINFGFAKPLKMQVQNRINHLNNNITGVDIVFKKSNNENRITAENKLNDEKTISEMIRTDRQIKSVSPQILQGEISSIANKVYKLLERRLSIEKEKRGAHIIG